MEVVRFSFVLAVYVFVAALAYSPEDQETSSKSTEQLCSQNALVSCAYPTSINEITFATKREDLDTLCPHLHSGLRCIDNYTRICLHPDQRSHFNKLYAGTSMVIQEICQPGHYQEEFLRHAPCMNKLTAEYEICVSKYQTQLGNISQNQQEASEGLKKICGNLHDYLECSKKIVKKTCGEETATFAAGFLDRMANSLLRRHCTKERTVASLSTSRTVSLMTQCLATLFSFTMQYGFLSLY